MALLRAYGSSWARNGIWAVAVVDPLTHCMGPGSHLHCCSWIFFFLFKAAAVGFLFVCLFCFLGLHPQHMDVPRLGVELQLKLPSYATATAMPDLSHVRAEGNARSPTHWVRPGIKPTSSWILVEFVSASPQWELLQLDSCAMAGTPRKICERTDG